MTASETSAGLRPAADVPDHSADGAAHRGVFGSILYGGSHPPVGDETAEDPDFFVDLNLDQVVRDLTANREGYRLRPYFCTPLRSLDQVRYRQDVLEDLDDAAFPDRIRTFSAGMRSTRDRLRMAGKLRSGHQRATWVLYGLTTYCAAVRTLVDDLGRRKFRAAGWLAFHRYLTAHVRGAEFAAMDREATGLQIQLTGLTYSIRIRGGTVGVSPYEGEDDYAAQVTDAFAKFRQGDVDPGRLHQVQYPQLNHVEAQILDRVAMIFPDLFRRLHAFVDVHSDFIDDTIALFDREVQFYLAYLEFLVPLRAAGLPFCRPDVVRAADDVRAHETFDLALAAKLVPDGTPVVRNDVELAGRERIAVVTGPNQGGKTTWARAFGQLHHLAALGLLVPGSSARLPLADRVFTQFEHGENMTDLNGKLADDLSRIRAVLDGATERSVVVINEIFTSTTLQDSRFLGEKVLRMLIERGCLGVYVTFVDELASLASEVVSMVSTVDPADPAVRTLKVVRRAADGLAYADVLAAKYGLSHERIAERVTS